MLAIILIQASMHTMYKFYNIELQEIFNLNVVAHSLWGSRDCNR